MNTAAAGTLSRNISGDEKDYETPGDKSNFLSGDELNFHIRACASNDRLSQKKNLCFILWLCKNYMCSVCK